MSSGPGVGQPAASQEPGASSYVLPFALFLLLLAVLPLLELGARLNELLRLLIVGGALLVVSRPVLDFRVRRTLASTVVGVLLFLVWIAPDLLLPWWRDLPLFSNSIVGRPESGFPVEGRADPVALGLRVVRAAGLVPVMEELFWRGWLPRWIVNSRWKTVPLGTYTPAAFWITAVLFAVEHGSWWDVGLLAGLGYNWWMMRTRSLGDLMLAHAVTNACLAGWVIASQQWEYW